MEQHMLDWRSNILDRENDRAFEKFCAFLNETNGVHQHSDGTYWWYDETQADEYGGYATFDAALMGLKDYCKYIL